MGFRCQVCRKFHRGDPFERVGLGWACSPACVREAVNRSHVRPRATSSRGGIPATVRTAVLERDGGCRYCGVRVGLHLHHINYRSEGVDHSETNLITLCARHHDLVHSNKTYWKPVLQAYITDLYDAGRKNYLRDIARHLNRPS